MMAVRIALTTGKWMDHQTRFATSPDDGRTIAALINAYDWARHPLGEIPTWPRALRNLVSTMLASRFPMYLAWGPEGFSFYNDGYIAILTDKHPRALGATFEAVWGELTPDIRALIDRTSGDQTSYFEDMPLTLLKNGKLEQCYFTFSYSGVRGDSGDVEGFYAVCLETTQAVRAKQRQTSEGERLRTLFQQAPGFMAVMRGPNHVLEIANDAYHALVGKTRELIGKSVLEAIPEAQEQGFIALLDDVFASGKPFLGRESRFVLSRAPNEAPVEMYVDFVYQPIVDPKNQVIGIMAQGHEVTEAYFARQALVAADRQKDQFIATLAHELRNPLAPIRAASHLLQLPNMTADRLEKTTAVISRQVEHMAKLLDDLLDVARISRNQVRLVKVRTTVETIIATAVETAKPLIDRKNQEIAVRHHGVIQLDGDLVRLVQVVSNLVCNAAKYTDFGGKIIVSTMREGDRCLITVTDNGIGIHPEALDTIFDMFTQENEVIERSEGGLGIGLGLVKGLVDLHGGTVHAASDGRQKGSTFTVVLPCLAQNAVREAYEPAQSGVTATAALKILVADDNIDLVDVLVSFLTILGHETLVANDGVRALALAKQALPDIAIVDIGMPGMNGYALAQAIRNEAWGRHIVLVAATGWGSEEDQGRTKSAGFDMHLTKPFGMDKLAAILQQVRQPR